MAVKFEHRANEVHVREGKQLNFPPHLHSEIEVVVVTEGTITLRCEGEERRLDKGDIAVLFPNCIHEYLAVTEGKMVMYIINAQLVPEMTTAFLNYVPVEYVVAATHLASQIDIINGYFLNQSQNKTDALTQAHLHLLFALLLNELELTARKKNQSQSITVQTIQYISEHFHESLDLQTIADHIGCSKYTVSRVFSDTIKIGFRNYLNQIRIEYARRLLQNTDLPIIEIALECGFETTRTFHRAYAKVYEESPTVIRKKPTR